MTMLLTPRLAAYLFKIGQKLQKGEYVEGLMRCPECDTDILSWDQANDGGHVVIKQKIGDQELYYCVVGCEGYWIVDPRTLGLPRGKWMPSFEIIKKRLVKHAKDKWEVDIEKTPLDTPLRRQLANEVKRDTTLDPVEREDFLDFLE